MSERLYSYEDEWLGAEHGRQVSGFSIELEELGPLCERLQRIGVEDIRQIVDQRQEGAPHSLITQLLNDPDGKSLTHSHVLFERLNSDGDQTMHKLGLIYGVMACNDRYNSVMRRRLQADDPVAYRTARITAEHSYGTALDAQSVRMYDSIEGELPVWCGHGFLPRWWTERFREVEQTGDDAFSILNALIRGHMVDLVRTQTGTEPDESALNAFFTGMVDAKIFFKTYADWRQGVRTFKGYEYDILTNEPLALGDEAFELQSTDGVAEALERLKVNRTKVAWHTLTLDQVGPVRLLTEAQVVQIGPRTFQPRHRILVALQPMEVAGVSTPVDVTVELRRAIPSLADQRLDLVHDQPANDLEIELYDQASQYRRYGLVLPTLSSLPGGTPQPDRVVPLFPLDR